MRNKRRLTSGVALSGAILLGATACGGGGAGTNAPLTLGMLMAFSGPSVMEGQEAVNGCLPAEKLINEAGGVLGREVDCQEFDTRGAASDAVPAARQMMSTAGDILSVVGPSTAESAAVAPILDEAAQTMFSVAGDPQFDNNELEHFYRLVSSDRAGALAMAYYAQQEGFKNIALVFPAGASAQANVPPLLEAAESLGLNIVQNMTITAEQPSYRTEVARMLESNPDAILFETDAVTAGTFLADLKQGGGADIPLVTTIWAYTRDWQDAAISAYGSSESLQGVLRMVSRYSDDEGAGVQLFDETLSSMADQDGVDYETFGDSVYSRAHYDGAIIAALAATKAGSTESTVFNKMVRDIVAPGDDKTVVSSYADGIAAIEAGKEIQYVGANGEILLNEYNNVINPFAVYDWNAASDRFDVATVFDAEDLAEINTPGN
ncbi:ABC transporter substrate-binding protein [Arthrobacter sp. NPDC089319]|uniref:ABC transporter substrate-binding protein n=1 Tax=Arthrobacter sp. NPDC089319 TaxID=3155915 RepID=UPI003449616E